MLDQIKNLNQSSRKIWKNNLGVTIYARGLTYNVTRDLIPKEKNLGNIEIKDLVDLGVLKIKNTKPYYFNIILLIPAEVILESLKSTEQNRLALYPFLHRLDIHKSSFRQIWKNKQGVTLSYLGAKYIIPKGIIPYGKSIFNIEVIDLLKLNIVPNRCNDIVATYTFNEECDNCKLYF